MSTLKGTAGNDTLVGTSANDVFNLVQGGEDSASGLEGNDVFHFIAAFDAGDQIDGGSGNDTITLRGDYSVGIVFNADTIKNVEVITLAAGDDYKLTTNDANVGAGQSLFINALALGAANVLTFDGSAETDGSLLITGGKGDDVLTGGAGDDIFDLSRGGEDTAHGGGGSNTFDMGDALDAGDTIDGGTDVTGLNVVQLDGDYSKGLTLGATTLSNIQEIGFHAGYSYNIVTNDANFAAGANIVINGTHLSGSHTLKFNAGADTNSFFHISGGAGNDTIIGGRAGNIIDLSLGGHDTAIGGAGSDTFLMGGTFGANDSIDGGGGNDDIQMDGMGTASALTFKATTMVNVENLVLLAGHDYVLTTNDANVASGQSLTVNAIRLGVGDTLTFNGGAETDGSFAIDTGAGNATLTGGAQADVFNITRGGTDTIHGGGGDDTITAGATFVAADQIDGGTGNDTLKLNGDYSAGLSFSDATITNIETLSLAADHSYKLTTADGNVASGQTLTVDGSALGANEKLAFDGSAETNGFFDIKGGGGNDTIALNAANVAGDTIDGGAGNDTVALSGSGALALSGTKITNVEAVSFADSGSYSATISGNIASTNGALTLNAAALTAVHSIGIDMSAATSTVNVTGGAGDDMLTVGSNLSHLGTIDGGAGTDTLAFSGNLVKPTLSGTTITHVEKLVFADGGSYPNIGISGDLTGTHGTLDVDASALTGSTSIIISALQATSGIDFTGGAGNDTLVLSDLNIANAGTAGDGGGGDNLLQIDTVSSPLTLSLTSAQFQHFDRLDFAGSKNVTVGIANDFADTASTLAIDAHLLSGSATVDASSITAATVAFTGGSGNDAILFSNSAHNWGALDGGTGNNTLELTGGGSATLSGGTIKEFTALTLAGGHYSQVTVTGDITTGGASLSIDASVSTGANIDLSAATTSLINVSGGTGDDYVIFHGFNAAATFVGGDGYNEIAYQAPQSGMTFTSANYANVDEIDFNGTGNYTNIAVVGDLTAGGDNAGDIDIYAGVLTGQIAIDLSAVTTSEIDFGGSSGDDTVTLSTANFNGTYLNGQSGNDTVVIEGNGTNFTAHTLTNANARNIANFDLTGDNNFSLKFAAGIAEATNSVSVDASALTAGHSASVDFSHATTNSLSFTGGAGDDTVLFSAASLAHASGVSGGGGNNTFALTGDGQDVNTTFNGDIFAFFSTLAFEDGNNYDVTVASPFFTGVAAPLTIDASALTASYGATVDVTAIAGTVNFTGGAGNDTVIFSSDNDNWGTVNGGAGNNIFEFNDGSAAIVDGASVTNFSTLSFADGHDYSGIQVTGDITGNNGTLTVDSSAVSGGHSVDVDLSGVTSSGIAFTGGSANDTVVFGSNLANVVSADGGGGTNTLALTGNGHDVTTIFSGANLANFSGLALEDGNNYDITVTGGFGGEAGLNIDASALSATHGATIDASGLTNFSVDFTGGAGNDTVLAGADLANMTIDGGGGSDVLKLDGDYSAGVTLSSVTNIGEIDLAAGNSYNLTTTDATVAAGATLTVDASALGPNSSLTFDGSAETDGYFAIKGGAGDDSLTLQTLEIDNSTIDGGAGVNSLTLTGAIGGDESFNAASITHIDTIAYVAGSDAGGVSFTGDITGDGGTLTVDDTNADGEGGSGPDGDMLLTDISALTDTIDLTGGVIDDYVSVSSVNWTSLNGNGGNYNAINDVGTGPITFDAATITGFNALVFANSTDYSGIAVVGDLTGNGGTLAIDAAFANSISIDVSQATSAIAFTGSSGDDTIAFGNGFTSGDTVAGNGGNDTLSLGANAVTISDAMVTAVSKIAVFDQSNFAVTGDITSGGGTLTVDDSAAGSSTSNAIDFSGATTKVINFTGGASYEILTFNFAEANWGNVDGGGGFNALILTGGGTAAINGASVTHFGDVVILDGANYQLALNGDITGDGSPLSVDVSQLSYGYNASIDASGLSEGVTFVGGISNDTFTGSSHGDVISILGGGCDTVFGGSGDDTINASGGWISGDYIDGGAGTNTLVMSGVAAFGDTNATNIQTLYIDSGTTLTGNIAGAGETLTIDGPVLGGIRLDLSGATTTTINFTGGIGDDTVVFGSNIGDAGNVDGGGGTNALELTGNGSDVTASLDGAAFTNFSTLNLEDGNNYNITVTSGFGGSDTLGIDASAISPTYGVTLDASALSGETVNFAGGAGDDMLVLSSAIGTINGGGGNDTLELSGGSAGLTAILSDMAIHYLQNVVLEDGSNYDLTISGDITSGSGLLDIDASALTGTNAATIDLSSANTSIIDFTGGAGDDTVIFSMSGLVSAGALDGGGGSNTLELNGVDNGISTYTSLNGSAFTNFSTLLFADGGNYNITFTSGFGGSDTLNIDASNVSSSYIVVVDASALSNETVNFTGGAGDDTIVLSSAAGTINGGEGYDTLELTQNSATLGANIVSIENVTLTTDTSGTLAVSGDISGTGSLSINAGALSASSQIQIDLTAATTASISVTGGQGDDTIEAGANISTISINGNGGNDTLTLLGGGTDLSAIIANSAITNIQNVVLGDGNNYDLTFTGDITSISGTLTIDASVLTGTNAATVNVSGVTMPIIDFTGGQGDDSLTADSSHVSGDIIDGGSGGDDTLTIIDTGNFSANVSLSDSSVHNIETLDLQNSSYTTISGDITSGAGTLTINAMSAAILDISQATTATINVFGSTGDDTITIGGGFAGSIDGGAGSDTLKLGASSGTETLSSSNLVSVEHVVLAADQSYTVTVVGDISRDGTLSLDASALSSSSSVEFNLTAASTSTITVTGGAGSDIFDVGAHLAAMDITGGGGDDAVFLNGDYSAGLTLSMLHGITEIDLAGGHSYTFTTSDGYVVNGMSLDSDDVLTLDGSAATGGNFYVYGGAGDDFISVGDAGGFVKGGDGDDHIAVGDNLAGLTIDGGNGNNTLALNGDYSAGVTLSMISNIGEVDLTAGHSYNITLDASNASSGDFHLAGGALGAGDSLTVDSTAVISGEVDIDGGAGNDTITTGNASGNTYIDLSQGGDDTVHGGAGTDAIYMGDALTAADSIDGGGGYNYVYLEGDSYAGGFNLSGGELSNINYVQLFGNHTYVLTGDPATLNSSNYVIIDGGAMTGGSLQFDGSAVTDGAFSLYGGAGDDILKGGSGNDTLDLSVGGEDRLEGNGGNDIINAGSGLDAGDQVDGGAGADTLNFDGDYSAGLVLGATTVTNVETFHFAAGHSYNITTNDATVSGTEVADTLVPGTLTVDGSQLGASDVLIFNGSAETDGSFVITGGAGNDVLTGGAGNDIFHLGHGGDDTVQGGAGNDVIYGEAGYSSGDMIDGGTGINTFFLGGKDYTGASAVTFTAANFVNIQTIDLNVSHNYSLTMNDANVPAGATMTVDGHLAKSFTFDGSAETDGYFKIVASTGADVLAGGALSDTFVFDAVNYSTSTTYDTLTNLNFSSDSIQLGSTTGVFLPTGIDAAITSGALSAATFNTDLATAVSSFKLAADHAVLFTADSGTLSGHTFLVIDHNGVAGYQESADYVIDVTGYSGTLTTGSFI